MQLTVLLQVLAGLLVVAGLAGTVLPALPGAPLIFAGMLLSAWAGGFVHVGAPTLAVLAALTLVSVAIDFWATAHGAKRVGASGLAMAGAVVGTLVGLFFGIPGLLLGPFAGALAGELLHRRSLHPQAVGHSVKVGAGTWLGILLGTVLKIGLAFTMLGVFALGWWL